MHSRPYLADMPVTVSMEPESVAEAVALTLAIGSKHPRLRVHVTPERLMTREEFLRFCAEHPDVRAELRPDGTLDLMSPVVLSSNEKENIVSTLLTVWWMQHRRGKVYGPTAGFTLPDGSVRSPDAAWLSPETVARLSAEEFNTMAQVVPDFVIEVMSKTDNLERAKAKMAEVWMANGVRLAWLVRPAVTQVLVYRQGEPGFSVVKSFKRGLSAEPVVPGFEMDLRELL